MPIALNGKTYYRIAEACQIAGISKNTFLRWVREQRLSDTSCRDRRGWRVFDEDELQNLKDEANKIQIRPQIQEPEL